jgi:two-component system OmpR family response regulator
MDKILVIDDNEDLLLSVSKYLTRSGFEIITSKNGNDGFKILNENTENIDLIIVDMVMPIVDGIEFCRMVRGANELKDLPVLMLTSLSDISDKYIAFDAGADDYLTKPFELLELLLRVKSLLKRKPSYEVKEIKPEPEPEEVAVAEINPMLDKSKSTININNWEIYLTSLEFSIIEYLYKNSDRAVSADELLEKIMNYPPGSGNPEAIRTHIKNLRSKIEPDPAEPKILINVPRRGYRYNVNG